MRCDKKDLLLYTVTDRSWLGEQTLYEQVEEALKGGAIFAAEDITSATAELKALSEQAVAK